MAHAEGNGGPSRPVLRTPSYTRYKDSETLPPLKGEPGAYHSLDRFPPIQIRNNRYPQSPDPSLQLPPLKNIEGFTEAPTLPHIQRLDSPNGERQQQPVLYYQPSHPPQQYLSPNPAPATISPSQTEPERQRSQSATSPPDRTLSGDKHRKEIKRRTKTGCLTCRKRRIKCDETHPVCRNCQKSKRDCAGYEPLFRTQPSTHNYHTSAGTESSSSASVSATPDGPSHRQLPHGYGLPPPPPPPPHPRQYHQSPPNYHPPPAAPVPQYGFLTAGNRPLAPNGEASRMSARTNGDVRNGTFERDNSYEGYRPYSRGSESGLSSRSRSGPLTIDDLYTIGAGDPPTPKFSRPMSAEITDQIKYMFLNEYGVGIDRFLETNWYTSDGVDCLLADSKLCEMFAGILELFQTTKSDNYDMMRLLPLTESRLIWKLVSLARAATPNYSFNRRNSSTSTPIPPHNEIPGQPRHPQLAHQSSNPTNPPSSTLQNVLSRLSILETLITGRTLPANPLSDGPNPNTYPPHTQENYRLEFWRELGHFVTLPPTQPTDQDACLGRLRMLLDMVENRDVLFSMAVVRRYGPSYETVTENGGSHDRDGSAARDELIGKLRVAKKFLEDEAAGKGTNQVVQRLCGMAVRSWASMR